MLSLRHFGLQIDWLDRLLADVADSCFSEFRIGPTLDPATSVSAQAGGARTVATDCIWFRSRPEAVVAAAALNDQQKCTVFGFAHAPNRWCRRRR